MAQHNAKMEHMIKTVMQKAPQIMHHVYALEGWSKCLHKKWLPARRG